MLCLHRTPGTLQPESKRKPAWWEQKSKGKRALEPPYVCLSRPMQWYIFLPSWPIALHSLFLAAKSILETCLPCFPLIWWPALHNYFYSNNKPKSHAQWSSWVAKGIIKQFFCTLAFSSVALGIQPPAQVLRYPKERIVTVHCRRRPTG